MTDLVKERRTYVIDENGKCGGLEGFKVICKVPHNYPKIIPAEQFALCVRVSPSIRAFGSADMFPDSMVWDRDQGT